MAEIGLPLGFNVECSETQKQVFVSALYIRVIVPQIRFQYPVFK
jgi:hypothetical protein